MVITLSNR